MKRTFLPVALLLVATLAPVGISRVVAGELRPGDAAPAFELPGSDGKTYKLADFKDKQVVVIAWYPKAFTGGCTAECKSLCEKGEAIRQYDVTYFAASCDIAKLNKEFAESLKLDYPILSDPTRSAAADYGVIDGQRNWPRRWTFFIGVDGKILAIDKAVKTETHGTDVAAKLKKLGVKERKKEKKAKP